MVVMSFPLRMFQSTPVIANGRIFAGTVPLETQCCFNPRPLLLTGESPRIGHDPLGIHAVSIHARYC